MDTNDAIVRGLGLTPPQAAMLVAALRDPRGRPTMAPPSPRMALIPRGCFDEGYPHTITATGRGLAEEMLATGWRDIDPVLEVLPPTVIANLPAAPAPQPFDYSGWQPQLADAARAAAATIRRHMERSVASMVEAGECLRAIKDQLPHGEWQAWLAAEFVMSDRMARHLLQVAEAFAGKTEIISVLSPTGAIKLAAAPAAARTAVVERLQAGEKMTVADISSATRAEKPDQRAGGARTNDSASKAVAGVVAPLSFATEFESQAIVYWRKSVESLGVTIAAIVEEIKSAADERAATGKPVSKKWALEMAKRMLVMIQATTDLTGRRYAERRMRELPHIDGFVLGGPLDDVFDALWKFHRRCQNVKDGGFPPPDANDLAAIRDRLVEAGM
jgi:hypothetical protein